MPFDAATYARDPLTITDPRERLEYLRDFLRELPKERFSMAHWPDAAELHRCGTAACIGGWADAIWGRTTTNDEAGERLGLSADEAWALFYPSSDWLNTDTTIAQALRVVDHFLATGEVDWSKAGER